MDFTSFGKFAKEHNMIPVYEIITADLLTPVAAYLKFREKRKNSFLLESVEGIGRLARFSFIGGSPKKLIYNYGNQLFIDEAGETKLVQKDILEYLSESIKGISYPQIEGLPDFSGGIVGYFGYENVSQIENSIGFEGRDKLEIPDSIFGFYDLLIAFDHFKHQIILIKNVRLENGFELEELYKSAKDELARLRDELKNTYINDRFFELSNSSTQIKDKEKFYDDVNRCKKHITEGDVFQIVLSRRFEGEFRGDLLNVYRALRIINPSPYMYFFEFANNIKIAGTSPEDLLKVKNNKATILPIAGTRKRGKTETEDNELEIDLMNDPKEIAEHTMLVDLARNDLGRVCEFGTVKVIEDKSITKFSHVMHIVSKVEGTLKEDKNCIDALRASFPAGTVTGAPKIKAIQLIDEIEDLKRNVYAGAAGYIDFRGNLDMCIAIRTLFAKENKLYWQAGAGIVADSKPELEYKEIHNKAAVILNALKHAEVIDENISN
ncbi:MAG: anthranilate synthase component I [Melioribacteraceae bacterium]|nr:anthranilate synthase component I [Melioribacteraceae bacterium]